MKCQNCESQAVVLTDHQPLDLDNKDFIDNEIYGTFHCENCDHRFEKIGNISWEK